MTGRHQALDRAAGAWARVHMTVAALQACVRMGAMGETYPAIFMAIAAKGCDGFGFGSLGVRVMAVFTNDACAAVLAGAPFVSSLLMAAGA